MRVTNVLSAFTRAHIAGGSNLNAPAQRVTDFLKGKISATLPKNSYFIGTTSADLREVLPKKISDALKEGLAAFGKKMKGYVTEEAILVGVESRSSSPVRIPRDKKTFQHPQIKNLYPCGEGRGLCRRNCFCRHGWREVRGDDYFIRNQLKK